MEEITVIWPFKKRASWEDHFRRGMSRGTAGDPPNAAKSFRQATRLAPEEPYPHYELGYTLSLLGRYEDALEELRTTNELAPGFFVVQMEIYLRSLRSEPHWCTLSWSLS